MKAFTLLSALAASALVVADGPTYIKAGLTGEQGVQIFDRLENQPIKDGGKRDTIKYGPYTIPANGMISKYEVAAKKPCSQCYITAIQATLKTLNNTEANIPTGSWLHHIILMSGAPMWAAGNERPPFRLNQRHKYGIPMGSGYTITADLMSTSAVSQTVTLDITYEYIPMAEATGYKASKLYWLQVGEPAARDGVYKFDSAPMTITAPAHLLYAIGHMHDGGTDTRLFINDQLSCKSMQHYNARPGYEEPASKGMEGMAGMEHGHGARDVIGGAHITDAGVCEGWGDVKTGDKLRIEAWYDANKYPLMTHNGEREKLMGVMRVFTGPTA